MSHFDQLEVQDDDDDVEVYETSDNCPLIQFANGFYQGFVDRINNRHGKGVFLWNSGELYYGDWKTDRMQGEGIFYFALGGYAYGTFSNDKVDGYAILCFPNGDYLAGFWEQGILAGKTIQYTKESDEWSLYDYKKGILERTLMRGKGKPPIHNLSMVETYYLKKLMDRELDLFTEEDEPNDRLSTKPIDFISIDVDGWYHGNIKNKSPHGLGIICYSSTKNDRGIFKDGKLDGMGRSLYPSGDVYDGFFKNGKYQGTGVYFKNETDQFLYGTYENNDCVQALNFGSGYPLELIQTVKDDFKLSEAEFVNKETSSEVLKLAFDDDEEVKIESVDQEQYNSRKKQSPGASLKEQYESNKKKNKTRSDEIKPSHLNGEYIFEEEGKNFEQKRASHRKGKSLNDKETVKKKSFSLANDYNSLSLQPNKISNEDINFKPTNNYYAEILGSRPSSGFEAHQIDKLVSKLSEKESSKDDTISGGSNNKKIIVSQYGSASSELDKEFNSTGKSNFDQAATETFGDRSQDYGKVDYGKTDYSLKSYEASVKNKDTTPDNFVKELNLNTKYKATNLDQNIYTGSPYNYETDSFNKLDSPTKTDSVDIYKPLVQDYKTDLEHLDSKKYYLDYSGGLKNEFFSAQSDTLAYKRSSLTDNLVTTKENYGNYQSEQIKPDIEKNVRLTTFGDNMYDSNNIDYTNTYKADLSQDIKTDLYQPSSHSRHASVDYQISHGRKESVPNSQYQSIISPEIGNQSNSKESGTATSNNTSNYKTLDVKANTVVSIPILASESYVDITKKTEPLAVNTTNLSDFGGNYGGYQPLYTPAEDFTDSNKAKGLQNINLNNVTDTKYQEYSTMDYTQNTSPLVPNDKNDNYKIENLYKAPTEQQASAERVSVVLETSYDHLLSALTKVPETYENFEREGESVALSPIKADFSSTTLPNKNDYSLYKDIVSPPVYQNYNYTSQNVGSNTLSNDLVEKSNKTAPKISDTTDFNQYKDPSSTYNSASQPVTSGVNDMMKKIFGEEYKTDSLEDKSKCLEDNGVEAKTNNFPRASITVDQLEINSMSQNSNYNKDFTWNSKPLQQGLSNYQTFSSDFKTETTQALPMAQSANTWELHSLPVDTNSVMIKQGEGQDKAFVSLDAVERRSILVDDYPNQYRNSILDKQYLNNQDPLQNTYYGASSPMKDSANFGLLQNTDPVPSYKRESYTVENYTADPLSKELSSKKQEESRKSMNDYSNSHNLTPYNYRSYSVLQPPINDNHQYREPVYSKDSPQKEVSSDDDDADASQTETLSQNTDSKISDTSRNLKSPEKADSIYPGHIDKLYEQPMAFNMSPDQSRPSVDSNLYTVGQFYQTSPYKALEDINYLKNDIPKAYEGINNETKKEITEEKPAFKDEISEIIKLKLELIIREQGKTTEKIEEIKQTLNTKLEHLFAQKKDDDDSFREEFNQKLDSIVQQRVQDLTKEKLEELQSGLASRDKQNEKSFTEINEKLDTIIRYQSGSSPGLSSTHKIREIPASPIKYDDYFSQSTSPVLASTYKIGESLTSPTKYDSYVPQESSYKSRPFEPYTSILDKPGNTVYQLKEKTSVEPILEQRKSSYLTIPISPATYDDETTEQLKPDEAKLSPLHVSQEHRSTLKESLDFLEQLRAIKLTNIEDYKIDLLNKYEKEKVDPLKTTPLQTALDVKSNDKGSEQNINIIKSEKNESAQAGGTQSSSRSIRNVTMIYTENNKNSLKKAPELQITTNRSGKSSIRDLSARDGTVNESEWPVPTENSTNRGWSNKNSRPNVSHPSDDTLDYMSISSGTTRLRQINTTKIKPVEFQMRNQKTINQLEYEMKFNESQINNQSRASRTPEHRLNAPQNAVHHPLSTPHGQSSLAIMRSLTPNPQSRGTGRENYSYNLERSRRQNSVSNPFLGASPQHITLAQQPSRGNSQTPLKQRDRADQEEILGIFTPKRSRLRTNDLFEHNVRAIKGSKSPQPREVHSASFNKEFRNTSFDEKLTRKIGDRLPNEFENNEVRLVRDQGLFKDEDNFFKKTSNFMLSFLPKSESMKASSNNIRSVNAAALIKYADSIEDREVYSAQEHVQIKRSGAPSRNMAFPKMTSAPYEASQTLKPKHFSQSDYKPREINLYEEDGMTFDRRAKRMANTSQFTPWDQTSNTYNTSSTRLDNTLDNTYSPLRYNGRSESFALDEYHVSGGKSQSEKYSITNQAPKRSKLEARKLEQMKNKSPTQNYQRTNESFNLSKAEKQPDRLVYRLSEKAKQNFIIDSKMPELNVVSEILSANQSSNEIGKMNSRNASREFFDKGGFPYGSISSNRSSMTRDDFGYHNRNKSIELMGAARHSNVHQNAFGYNGTIRPKNYY